MAIHVEVKIKIAYDESSIVPTKDDLEKGVALAMGAGLFNQKDSQIEEWEVEVEESPSRPSTQIKVEKKNNAKVYHTS